MIIRVKLRDRYLMISEYNLHRAAVISGTVQFILTLATQVFQDSGLMGLLGYYTQSSSPSVMESSTGDGKSHQALDSDIRDICDMKKVKCSPCGRSLINRNESSSPASNTVKQPASFFM